MSFKCPFCEFDHLDLRKRNLHVIENHRFLIETDYKGGEWSYWRIREPEIKENIPEPHCVRTSKSFTHSWITQNDEEEGKYVAH